MFAANSLIFVPGSRPERFAKPREAGAGLTVIDLEDAVAPEAKDEARSAALRAVAEDPTFALRINGATTPDGIADLYHLARADVMPAFLLVPMIQSMDELAVVRGGLGDACPPLVPLVETPRGLRRALDIASAPGVVAVMFGGGDFSGELGVELAWQPLLGARQALILACAEAGVPAIDVPWVHLDDHDGLRVECDQARALGFACKAAIHPRQVPVIEEAFAPTAEAVAEAEEALAAFQQAGGRAIRHKGRMLEAPLVKHYRAIIARSERTVHA